jgi:hypothetical protein
MIMKNIFRALCVVVFVVALLAFSLAKNSNQAQVSTDPNDLEPARPYVIKIVQYRINKNGSKSVMSQSIRYTKANSDYRQITYRADGPTDDDPLCKYTNRLIICAALSDGIYTKGVGSNTLIYESARTDKQVLEFYRFPYCLRNNPNFVRTDKIAGLDVYVLRHEIKDPASHEEWIEESYSPKTGDIWLRMIIHFRDGLEVMSEAVSIEFKEVPEDLNDDLKDLPISNIEEKIRKQSQK